MNLLPVATPTAPVNTAGAEDPAATGSGDFTALLAMLVGAASTTLPIDTSWISSAGSSGAADPTSPMPTATAETAVDPLTSLLDTPVAPMTSSAVTDGAQGEPTDQERGVEGLRAQPAQPAVRAEHALPAQPAVPAVPAHRAIPAEPAGGATSRPAEAHRAQPAVPATPGEPAVRAQPAASGSTPEESAVPVPGGPAAEPSVSPGPVPAEHERRPETMTLPETARFDQPPLGAPAAPGHDPGQHQEADRRRNSDRPDTASPVAGLQAVSPSDQLPVDVATADHVEALPGPKGADRSAAAVAPAGAATPVVPLVAANRSEALAPVETPAAPTVPATVPEQIVSAVVPLHGRGDGRHEVTLELRPDHLGTIRVEVSVEHQTVNLTLHAAEPATSRLLSAALPELRSALTDAGLTAGQVGVGVDGGSGERRSRPQAESEPRVPDTRRPVSISTSTITAARRVAAGRLDLFL